MGLRYSTQDAEAVGRALYLACRDVGFAYLINTSIPQEDVAGMFEWSAKFFALPAETKNKAPHPPEGYKHRGYSGIGKEQVSLLALTAKYIQLLIKLFQVSQMVFDPEKLAMLRKQGADHKESYEIGNEDDKLIENVWLPEEYLPGFRDYAVQFWNTCRKFEDDLLDALSIGMPGVPPGMLKEYHADARNQLR